MTRQKRLQDRQKEKIRKIEYQYIKWDKYDYSILNNILDKNTSGKGRHRNYNDAFIMFDTETSKKEKKAPGFCGSQDVSYLSELYMRIISPAANCLCG